MNESFQSVVITGAAGMLGRALVAALRARGVQSHAFARAALDITDDAALARVFAEHRPTLFLNSAAHTKVDLCETEPDRADAINGHAVGNIARLCKQHGTALVHYSTDFIFDGKSTRPYRVEDTPNPISAYGRSKLLGESELQANAPSQWLIIRTAWVYGEGGINFPRIIVERARGGHALKVVNDEIGSPTFTIDLAAATLELIDCGATGIIHATNGGAVNRYEYARAVLEEFGVQADLSPITTAQWLEMRPNQAPRPAYSVLDDASLIAEIARPVRPWREALHEYQSRVQRAGF